MRMGSGVSDIVVCAQAPRSTCRCSCSWLHATQSRLLSALPCGHVPARTQLVGGTQRDPIRYCIEWDLLPRHKKFVRFTASNTARPKWVTIREWVPPNAEVDAFWNEPLRAIFTFWWVTGVVFRGRSTGHAGCRASHAREVASHYMHMCVYMLPPAAHPHPDTHLQSVCADAAAMPAPAGPTATSCSGRGPTRCRLARCCGWMCVTWPLCRRVPHIAPSLTWTCSPARSSCCGCGLAQPACRPGAACPGWIVLQRSDGERSAGWQRRCTCTLAATAAGARTVAVVVAL